jgi:hypothetical protein
VIFSFLREFLYMFRVHLVRGTVVPRFFSIHRLVLFTLGLLAFALPTGLLRSHRYWLRMCCRLLTEIRLQMGQQSRTLSANGTAVLDVLVEQGGGAWLTRSKLRLAVHTKIL